MGNPDSMRSRLRGAAVNSNMETKSARFPWDLRCQRLNFTATTKALILKRRNPFGVRSWDPINIKNDRPRSVLNLKRRYEERLRVLLLRLKKFQTQNPSSSPQTQVVLQDEHYKFGNCREPYPRRAFQPPKRLALNYQ